MFNQKGSLSLIVAGIAVIFIVGVGAYYLGTKNYGNPSEDDIQPSISLSTSESIPNSAGNSPEMKITLPVGWTIQESKLCGIKIPLPPTDKGPYMKKEQDITWFWQFSEGSGSQIFDLTFDNSASAKYNNDKNLGSGQVLGMVLINCSDNTTGDTTSSYADFVVNSIKNRNFYMGEEVVCQPVQSKEVKWGRDIVLIKPGCKTKSNYPYQINDDYYVYADTEKIYLFQKISDSGDSETKNATSQIFDSLQFSR